MLELDNQKDPDRGEKITNIKNVYITSFQGSPHTTSPP